MTITSFLKDLWNLIKDYKWFVLIVTLITVVLSFGLNAIVSRSTEQDRATNGEFENYQQVGYIDIYQDTETKDFQLQPFLPDTVIEELHTWDTFRAMFSLNTSNPEIDEDQAVGNYFDESAGNPIEDFLGVDPTQHDDVRIHPDTGNVYATFEIDPESGNMSIVNVQEGFNDFRIQLDVDGEEGTFAGNIPENTDDLLNVKIGMTPGSEQFGYIESIYDWNSGINYPRMFGNKTNFYITDPVSYTPVAMPGNADNPSMRDMITLGVVALLIGFMLSVFLAFIWSFFRPTINYSYAYAWAADDLYLKYDTDDTAKQITHDMLQSRFHHIAVISQNDLPDKVSEIISQASSKDIMNYNEISDISLDKMVEEFVLVVERKKTTKNWYDRQRKHLKAYRNISVKVVEI